MSNSVKKGQRSKSRRHIAIVGDEAPAKKKRSVKDPVSLEYTQQDFRIPAQDARGHKERLSFDLPPGYANQIGVVIGSGRFPYETEGQFLRHATHRHLEWLGKLEPDLPNDLAALKIMNEVVSRQEMMLKFAASLYHFEQIIAELIDRGMRGEAVRTVWQISEAVEGIEQPQWYNYFAEEVQKRWGHLLKTKPVRLTVAAEDDTQAG